MKQLTSMRMERTISLALKLTNGAYLTNPWYFTNRSLTVRRK